jgi:hypothetical protein
MPCKRQEPTPALPRASIISPLTLLYCAFEGQQARLARLEAPYEQRIIRRNHVEHRRALDPPAWAECKADASESSLLDSMSQTAMLHSGRVGS